MFTNLWCDGCCERVNLINTGGKTKSFTCKCGKYQGTIASQEEIQDEDAPTNKDFDIDKTIKDAIEYLRENPPVGKPTDEYCGECSDVIKSLVEEDEGGELVEKTFGCSCGMHQGEKYEG